MNVQVIARPTAHRSGGPRDTHDMTAAPAHGIIQVCHTRRPLFLADRAYQGTDATDRTPHADHAQANLRRAAADDAEIRPFIAPFPAFEAMVVKMASLSSSPARHSNPPRRKRPSAPIGTLEPYARSMLPSDRQC
ncbi:hypothetical protein RKD29_007794 [Streptomyces tendae]